MIRKLVAGVLFSVLAGVPVRGEEAVDSLLVENGENLSTRYSVVLNRVQLPSADGEWAVRATRTSGSRSVGLQLIVRADEMVAVAGTDTTIVARCLPDGLEPHDYALLRSGVQIQVYRDGILFGKVQEKFFSVPGSVTLFQPGQMGEESAVTLYTDSLITLNEQDKETAIDHMLPSACGNLITDPYANKGFTQSGLNAGERIFYTQQAIYTGWGPSATIDGDAYSGARCIRIDGQAVYPDRGASVDVAVSLTANTPYYIRAMVKSDGYVGKIGISNCDNFISITDTGGEWRQVEGVLTPTAASALLYINNADFENSGTLWVDNIELYKGYTSTSAVGLKTEVPYVGLPAGTEWAPSRLTNVYMLGFTDNGTTCSTIDTTKVVMKGGSSLTRPVKGSQWYSLCFPGELRSATVNGYFDGVSHVGTPLEYGVDYVMQRYDHPRFVYVGKEEARQAGSYLVQFVDNMDGTNVTFTFGTRETVTPSAKPYYSVGNTTGTNGAPEGRFYRFDEDKQCYLLTSGSSVKPFEAYIVTDATVPVDRIVPNGVANGLQRVYGENGARVSVSPCAGGLTAYAAEPTDLSIYAVSGMCVRTVSLRAGRTFISLPKGLYVAGGRKLPVR